MVNIEIKKINYDVTAKPTIFLFDQKLYLYVYTNYYGHKTPYIIMKRNFVFTFCLWAFKFVFTYARIKLVLRPEGIHSKNPLRNENYCVCDQLLPDFVLIASHKFELRCVGRDKWIKILDWILLLCQIHIWRTISKIKKIYILINLNGDFNKLLWHLYKSYTFARSTLANKKVLWLAAFDFIFIFTVS